MGQHLCNGLGGQRKNTYRKGSKRGETNSAEGEILYVRTFEPEGKDRARSTKKMFQGKGHGCRKHLNGTGMGGNSSGEIKDLKRVQSGKNLEKQGPEGATEEKGVPRWASVGERKGISRGGPKRRKQKGCCKKGRNVRGGRVNVLRK